MPVAAQAGSLGGTQMAAAVGGAHSSAPYLSSPQQAAVLKQHQILLEQQKQREQQQQHFLQRQQLLAEQVWMGQPTRTLFLPLHSPTHSQVVFGGWKTSVHSGRHLPASGLPEFQPPPGVLLSTEPEISLKLVGVAQKPAGGAGTWK